MNKATEPIRWAKWTLMGLLTVTAITAGGCSKQAGDKPAASAAVAATKEPVSLRVVTVPYGAGYGYVSSMARKFEAANPDVRIIVTKGADNVDVMALMKSDNSPDIVMVGANSFQEAIRQGTTVDLIPLFKKDNIDVNQIYKGALEAITRDGKMSAIPYDVHTMGVYYNKKRFDDQQIPYPKVDWTWSDFVETAKKLTQQGADARMRYGVHFHYDLEMVEALVFGNQGQYLSADGQADGYVNSPKTAEAIRLYEDLFRTHQVAAPPDSGDSMSMLKAGTAAMAFEFSYRASEIISDSNVGVVGLPTLPQGGHGNVVYVEGLGISAKSKQKDLAWRFLKEIGMPEGSGATLWGKNQLATTKKLADASGQAKDPKWSVFLNELNYAKRGAFYDNPVWNSLRNSHDADMKALITDGGDPNAMLAKWKQEYESKANLPVKGK